MEARMQALEDENAILKKRSSSKAGSTLLPLKGSLLTPKVVKSTTTDDHATEQQNHNTDTTTDNRQVQERCMRCNELAYGFMITCCKCNRSYHISCVINQHENISDLLRKSKQYICDLCK
ncbi:hypothetical protein WA556_004473 [Blastocystis sp. ATCC 50177/Nand II]